MKWHITPPQPPPPTTIKHIYHQPLDLDVVVIHTTDRLCVVVVASITSFFFIYNYFAVETESPAAATTTCAAAAAADDGVSLAPLPIYRALAIFGIRGSAFKSVRCAGAFSCASYSRGANILLATAIIIFLL